VRRDPHHEPVAAGVETAATSAGPLLEEPRREAVPDHIRRALEDQDAPARRSLLALRIGFVLTLVALLAAGLGMVAGFVPPPGELLP
jgi:hypothetical protein